MTILIHNTTVARARRILAGRTILANVERSRPYDVRSGPFFYMEGQDGEEMPSGGRRHEVDLFFDCSLPPTGPVARGSISRAIANQRYSHLRGRLVVGANDVSGRIEQALIVPDQWGCLTLLRAEPPLDRVRRDGAGALCRRPFVRRPPAGDPPREFGAPRVNRRPGFGFPVAFCD